MKQRMWPADGMGNGLPVQSVVTLFSGTFRDTKVIYVFCRFSITENRLASFKNLETLFKI